VTIVVPTRNRVARVLRLLDALARQTGPAFDVVIVDDGSTDGTATAVEQRAGSLPMPVRVLRNAESEGPARARNRGWRSGTAPVVVFTDDDCVPGEAWLADLVDALDRDRGDIVTGPTAVPDDQQDLVSLWSHQMVDDGASGHFSTSNVGYRREVLEAVNGFDESFEYRTTGLRRSSVRGINGEDTDLAWRAIELGFAPAFAPGAVVFHDVSPQSWRQHVRNMRRLEGIVLMYKKHPQLRAAFGRRVVFRPADVSALAVAAGLVGLGVRRLRPLVLVGIAGVVWHTRVYRRHMPPPAETGGYLVAIPLAIVADAYAAYVMLRASARYRTLLL
jgi:GT2 family glycosyltransferase